MVHGFSSKGWDTAFLTANATGYFNITGYDMSTACPGSRSPEDWQDSVQARTGVNFTSGPSPGLATGIWLRTHAPGNLLRSTKLHNGTAIQTLPQDETAWQLCPLLWAGPNLTSKTPLAVLAAPGSCLISVSPIGRKPCARHLLPAIGRTVDQSGDVVRSPRRYRPVATGLALIWIEFNEMSTSFSDNITDQSDINLAPFIPTNRDV
ncbi:hypothetical protein V8F33_002324 [Rhypophila sp. PSN 637]